METFMAARIEEAFDISKENGVTKYKAYFVRTRIYKKWRPLVDAILDQDGYADAIVTD